MKLTTENTENTERATPETDAVVRNAATANHPPTRLAATLTVKCEKLERERDEAREKYFVMRDLSNNATEFAEKYKRERDEARELNAKLIALAERATDDLRWFYESHADGISLELEKLKEGAK